MHYAYPRPLNKYRSPAQDCLATVFGSSVFDLVIDVGANSGEFGQILREVVGYQGEIHSFEPIPEAYKGLQQKAKRDLHWFTYNILLTNREGRHYINTANRSVQLSPISNVVLIEAKRIDSFATYLIPDFRKRKVLLNIDSRCGKQMVLEGAGKYLALIDAIHSYESNGSAPLSN